MIEFDSSVDFLPQKTTPYIADSKNIGEPKD